ncbi:hypothetical protein X777_09582 [Ooceraea biroi]|uniref:Endonuclease/exonuclease/phosphatase domain-containing protein n=1 Tax=Ooceraea biroi TaxID=2015173 RepID=A0A026WA35_OOCBI|nr:hypothetical protein X777_09582 [Ooceraea biroi]
MWRWDEWEEIFKNEEGRRKNRERERERGRTRGKEGGEGVLQEHGEGRRIAREYRKKKNGERWGEGKIGFWNVAGLAGKDEEFWREIGKWEVIILIETWVEEKGWEGVKRKTGEGGGKIEMEEEEREERRSKDKTVNGDGRRLLEELREMGLEILNGGIKGDEEGEYTYIGQRGQTVIDYVIVDGGMRNKIERMEVGERVESDHMPIVVTVKEGGWKRGGRRGRREEERGW